MNEILAQMYNTPGSLEKTAQSVLLSKLAEDEGIDLSGLSGDQLEEIAQSVLSESDEGYEGELAKEAEENFAQADFLGRVMAHSMTQELDLIKSAGIKDQAGKAWGAVKGHASKAYGAAKGGVKRYGNLMAGGGEKGMQKRPGNSLDALRGKKTSRGSSLGAARTGMDPKSKSDHKYVTSEARKSFGARAGTAAGVGALGAGGYALSKEASAFETLANQRALQMLQEQGYDVGGQQAQAPQGYGQGGYGQVQGGYGFQGQSQGLQGQGGYQAPGLGAQGGYEKVADPMEHFWGSVDERAYQLLGEAGYLEDQGVE